MSKGFYISFFSIITFVLAIIFLGLWLRTRSELKSTKVEIIKVETTLLTANQTHQDSIESKDIKIAEGKHRIDSLMNLKPQVQVIEIGGTQIDSFLCFDSTEVEKMKAEKVELAKLRSLTAVQGQIIDEQKGLIFYEEDKINELEAQRDNYKELYEKRKALSDKDIKRERNLKRVFMGATPVALILGIILF
jgi:hypothetical protein